MPDLVAIPGYPGYFAESDGSVWSTKSGELRYLRGSIQKRTGYRTVCIKDVSGDREVEKNVGAHTLICSAFHGPKPFASAQCRHRNAIRTDNRQENLAWGSVQQNCQDKFDHGNAVIGRLHWKNKLSEADVRAVRQMRLEGLYFWQIADRFNISAQHAWNICRGNSWSWLQ